MTRRARSLDMGRKWEIEICGFQGLTDRRRSLKVIPRRVDVREILSMSSETSVIAYSGSTMETRRLVREKSEEVRSKSALTTTTACDRVVTICVSRELFKLF